MSILLKNNIFIAGAIKGPTDGTLTLNVELEAELVNRRVANYVIKPVAPGENLVPLSVTTDSLGKTTAIDRHGVKIPFRVGRNALRTIACGNSICQESKYNTTTTATSTRSILHWGNIFGGSPFRFTRMTPTTRTDRHGVYAFGGATLATINSELPVQLFDPINTVGWEPECIVGIGLLENSIRIGSSIAAVKAEFNHWRRMVEAMWPGIIVVTHTPLPAFDYSTPAMVEAYQELGRWLRSEDDGFSLLIFDGDVYENPVIPSEPLPGFTPDVIHPLTNASSMLGRGLGRTMRRVSPVWRQPGIPKYNNPALSGTAAASGTNVSGTIATGFSIPGSPNGTFVGTAEQPGQLIAVVANSGAGPALQDLNFVNPPAITTADLQVSAFLELEIVSGAENIHALQHEPKFGDGASPGLLRNSMRHALNDFKPVYENGDILTFVTPPEVPNSLYIYTCTNQMRYNGILAGGAFSYRVRKQGIITTQTGTQVLNFGATITPDISLGTSVVIATLTGNTTIAAPLNPVIGKIITFNYTGNATPGWAITYNAVFKTSAVPVSTASGKATHRFSYDGTNWVQVGGPLVWL